jgi:GAF domain-containing protein
MCATVLASEPVRTEVAVSSHVTSDRERLAELAGEQTALRHIATLVARGPPAAWIFDAVAEEVGLLLGAEAAGVQRFEPDGEATVVGRWGRLGGDELPAGRRFKLDGTSVTAMVYRTQRSARIDSSQPPLPATAQELQQLGVRCAVASPIIVNGHLWGALAAASSRPEPLPADAESRIAMFTELVATAISNVQARAEVERLAEQEAALRRVATMVAQGPPPGEVFAQVAEEAGLRLGVEIVAIHRFEQNGEAYVVGSWCRSGDAVPVGRRFQLDGDSTVALVYRTRRPARVEDYTTTSGSVATEAQQVGVGSAVASPIVVDGRLWGAMAAGTSRGERLPTDAESRIAQFTELVATAIGNVQARAEVERLAAQQAALRRVATLVARGLSPEELFAAVSDEVGRLFGCEAAIARFEPGGSAMVVVGVTQGLPVFSIGTRWALEDFLASTAVYRTRRPARNEHGDLRSASGPGADALREMDFVSSVAAPIIVEGSVWGVMTVSDARERLPADTEERVEKFTGLVATAIANAHGRAALAASEARAHRLAREQAGLRRVATLVAEVAQPDDVFSAVAREVASVFGVELVTVCRYGADDIVVLSAAGVPAFPAGSRWSLEVPSLPGTISATGGPVRIDDFTDAPGLDALARDAGVKAAVGVPILVEGTVWGSINTASTKDGPLPADAEERLARFTELVATSVSNATMRAELAASRARIVAAADRERRRVVRDLHDGAQQRLVHTIITLKLAQRADHEQAMALVADARQHAELANTELRDLAHGILPSVLTRGGVGAAVEGLSSRTSIPVEIDVSAGRLPAPVEATAYFIVAEALTNIDKHAHAQRADVTAHVRNGMVEIRIRDDGIGGARPDGSGLVGLRDRVEALGGTMTIESPDGRGTTLVAKLPLDDSVAG